MYAHQARAAAAIHPAFDASRGALYRMKGPPVCGAHRSAFEGFAALDLLRVIASSDPDSGTLARKLAEVRTLLDRQRDHIRYRRANGEPFDEIAHAQTRLLDNTVIGLCHLGQRRLDQPVSIMPPLVVIARGDYGRQRLGLDANADLLVLLAADRSDHEQAVQLGGFVARELATLGWRVSLTMHTTCGHVSGACLDRAIASDLCAGRIVCGCEALIFELQTGLQEGALDPRTQTNRGMPEHLHALPLAA